jgi:hypothetical protein
MDHSVVAAKEHRVRGSWRETAPLGVLPPRDTTHSIESQSIPAAEVTYTAEPATLGAMPVGRLPSACVLTPSVSKLQARFSEAIVTAQILLSLERMYTGPSPTSGLDSIAPCVANVHNSCLSVGRKADRLSSLPPTQTPQASNAVSPNPPAACPFQRMSPLAASPA